MRGRRYRVRNERVARLSLPLQTWIPLSESAEAGQERGSRRRPSRAVYVSAAVPSEDIQSQTSDSKKKKKRFQLLLVKTYSIGLLDYSRREVPGRYLKKVTATFPITSGFQNDRVFCRFETESCALSIIGLKSPNYKLLPSLIHKHW